MNGKGAFIVFEGIDGCGKTTQARRLARHLGEEGHEVVSVEEPGGTPAGERVREILLDAGSRLEPLSELFLLEASRHELVRRVIRPALERRGTVVCQRYGYSSLAYQGYGRGLELAFIEALNERATEGLTPDLVLWLDVPAEEGLRRFTGRRRPDRLEGEGVEFLKRVEAGYRALLERTTEMVRIDGTQGPERAFEAVLRALERAKVG